MIQHYKLQLVEGSGFAKAHSVPAESEIDALVFEELPYGIDCLGSSKPASIATKQAFPTLVLAVW
jgi:hypothetical protein